MNDWVKEAEIDAAYCKVQSVDGRKPVALEARGSGKNRFMRFLFELPETREPYERHNPGEGCPMMPIYVVLDD